MTVTLSHVRPRQSRAADSGDWLPPCPRTAAVAATTKTKATAVARKSGAIFDLLGCRLAALVICSVAEAVCASA